MIREFHWKETESIKIHYCLVRSLIITLLSKDLVGGGSHTEKVVLILGGMGFHVYLFPNENFLISSGPPDS